MIGLQYSSGYVEYQGLGEILRKDLDNDYIYVREHQKDNFLATVVNIESIDIDLNFKNEISSWLNHRPRTYRWNTK